MTRTLKRCRKTRSSPLTASDQMKRRAPVWRANSEKLVGSKPEHFGVGGTRGGRPGFLSPRVRNKGKHDRQSITPRT
jgi:hypothetical protein